MHMFIMIVSWHHLVLNISTKDLTRFFGSQSKIERDKWCINCNHVSCHKSCFMITRVIWLLFNWILSKKCQRTTFSRSYRNFHLSPIFIITSIVGGSWRHGSSYLEEWKFKVVIKYAINIISYICGGTFTFPYLSSNMSRRWGFKKYFLINPTILFATSFSHRS
jgi:hypothetical protein